MENITLGIGSRVKHPEAASCLQLASRLLDTEGYRFYMLVQIYYLRDQHPFLII